MNSPKHIEEQSIWRLEQVKKKSLPCFQGNKCINCGCDVIESTFGNKGCDYGCYPDLMSLKDWEKYKKTNNLKF